ncbi:uncharacterized protein LOC116140158 isoform X2 [Pistacia vera]|uniref:uncharacterized protein LOC116140158 isoform X2 n=1 Tax=Pistacia vera TaxID=55513 RepID=UPI0012639D21|nr:uncharacterized protein LOC116140158 isoform X2 [Pistacia vera]
MEMPECPVCLQSYDSEYTIPRVLACGHTCCESCLLNLPHKFPDTIRCPACTVLVKYPPQGPSSLPKNIDLLRLIDPDPQKPHNNPKNFNSAPHLDFIPRTWSDEFYSLWKEYILPQDAVLVELKSGEDGGACFGCLSQSRSQRVSLVQVGSLISDDDSVFKYSYVVRVIKCLSGMKEEEVDELRFILRGSSKVSKLCRVLGLWGDVADGSLCIVCERMNQSLLESLGALIDEDGMGNDGLFGLAMMGMEMCEALIGFNQQGLILGCLGFSCFSFDDFGHVFVDLNEVLVIGRKIVKSVVEVGCGGRRIGDKEMGVLLSDLLKRNLFFSPELLFQLLKKEGIEAESGETRHLVGYGSDVWSLACILLGLLIGRKFNEELVHYICFVSTKAGEENSLGMYMGWVEKVSSLLENKIGSEFVSLQQMFCQCLNFDSGNRPLLTDVWRCLRELIIKCKFDKMIKCNEAVNLENEGHCLVLGELCWLPKGRLSTEEKDGLLAVENCNGTAIDQTGETGVTKDLVEGLTEGNIKFKDMQGHLDCVTGLAVGGGFLFSSSFDKSVHVWSLQDFSHVHTFKGHEHKVMAVVYVDEEQPLCISGDSGGGIFVWSTSFPLGQEPIKKWNEPKDWRYSGIHALASLGKYLYTGGGDKTIKVWSLLDGALSCTMNGHKSVVSTLAVCNGVLYSGSWDGTIRLWSLSDHSLLTVLEEVSMGNVYSVLSLTANQHTIVAAHENGSIKVL